MNENRSQKQKRGINGWKWAFLSLVSFLLIGVFLLFRALTPETIKETEQVEDLPAREEIIIQSSMTTEDAERLLNQYLVQSEAEENGTFELAITDQLEITGAFELFNQIIPYQLSFDPYVTEEGNLQLCVDTVNLASISMPVSTVLSLFAKGIDLPFYIGIDSETQLILVNFQALRNYYDMGIEMTKIDLESNDIQLNLLINQDTLIHAMDLQE